MHRSTHIACIATAFTIIIAGGIGESRAQSSETQGEYSGGTQGLQEKLYRERIKELQQGQAQSSGDSPQSRERADSSIGRSSQGTDSSGRPQGSSDGRTGGSGSSSGRQTDQPGKK